ncbi:retrovirus-related pol polyprotein from transposon TNT 1-94 [Tanacetum coccineum]
MTKNKDHYHDTFLNLKEKVKKNVDMVLKIGNSVQGMFMLEPKPMSFYDSKLKHGLGYANPYTLKKAVSQNLKLYDATCLDNSQILIHVRDTKDTLEDATKSQIKMKNKMQDPIAIQKKENVVTIDYTRLNALYDDFVPQKELSNEQKFPPSVISSENPSNKSSSDSSSETKPTNKPMPSANPILVDLNQMETDFQKLFKIMSATSRVRRSSNRDSSIKDNVVSNTKNSAKKVEVSDRTNQKPDVASKNIALNSVGQFCDIDLEVPFLLKTCYVRNLEGDDLLTRDCESNLYTISIPDMASSSPVYLMSKAFLTKSWLWHRRLSHLNFGTLNDLTKLDLVDGLSKFKYEKDCLCFAFKGARTMLIFSCLPEFLWAEAVSTACFTQNRSIIHTKYNKTPYELLCDRKPNMEYSHVFGSLCYPTNDLDDLGKMKPKADIAMAFEHDSLEPVSQRFINDDSSAESINTPSKEDLDNLFGPMFDEYFEKKSSDMPINSAAPHVHNHEDPPVQSSMDIDEHEVSPIVTTSKEQSSPISLTEANELCVTPSQGGNARHNENGYQHNTMTSIYRTTMHKVNKL